MFSVFRGTNGLRKLQFRIESILYLWIDFGKIANFFNYVLLTCFSFAPLFRFLWKQCYVEILSVGIGNLKLADLGPDGSTSVQVSHLRSPGGCNI